MLALVVIVTLMLEMKSMKVWAFSSGVSTKLALLEYCLGIGVGFGGALITSLLGLDVVGLWEFLIV